MRKALIDLLLIMHVVPRELRGEAMTRAMRNAQAALRGTLPDDPKLDADSALHVFRAGLDYCRRAGVPYSDMVRIFNDHDMPAPQKPAAQQELRQ